MPYSVVGCCEIDKDSPSLMSCVSKVTWSTVDLACRKPSCFCTSNGSMHWIAFDTNTEDLEGETVRHRAITLWVPNGLFGLGIATTSALLQILRILSWRMQEVKKPHSQDVRADPAWGINSGKIEFNHRDFSGSRWLRALQISSSLKGPEVLSP